MRRKKSIRKHKKSTKRSITRRKSLRDSGFINSIYNYFNSTTETNDIETKTKNDEIKKLRKVEKGLKKIIENINTEISKEQVWKETVDVLQNLNLPPPSEDYLWNKNDVARINWYITQIKQKEITKLLAEILLKSNP